jgi:8-oxo-dGTP pyrophosphatase MutT (NUDIX family)
MSFGRHFGPFRHDARQASVMALIYRDDDCWHLPLIVRPPQSLHHASQVSLPGGAVEPGEEPAQTALRELQEELGVRSDAVKLLGSLSPLYVFSSNNYVRPFVGWVDGRPRFDVNQREVARLMTVPLIHFLAPTSIAIAARGGTVADAVAAAYEWDGEVIWGATCMILVELAEIIRQAEGGRSED